MYKVTFDTKQIDNWVKKNQEQLPKLITTVVNKTSAYGLSETRRGLSKRSGNLRNSYTVKKETPATHVILSDSKYADSSEFGYASHVVKPTSGHMFLTVPLNNTALTGTKAQISKSALTNLFKVVGYNKKANKLYSKDKDVSISQQFQKVGVALARKVTLPAYKGSHVIEKTIVPKIDAYFMSKIIEGIKSIG